MARSTRIEEVKRRGKGRVPKHLLDERGLTPKQVLFVDAYTKTGGNGLQSALIAYDTEDANTAHMIASDNLQKPTVKAAIEAAMKKHGITLDAAIKPIADGLKAVRLNFNDDGSYEVIDHQTRLTASRMALKLHGADQDDGAGKGSVNFNFGTQNFVK